MNGFQLKFYRLEKLPLFNEDGVLLVFFFHRKILDTVIFAFFSLFRLVQPIRSHVDRRYRNVQSLMLLLLEL